MSKEFLTAICLFFAFLFLFVGCTPVAFYPDDGQWYCEELQLQLSFDSEGDCLFVYKDEVIACACGIDKGSTWLSVGCQETNSRYFTLGEEVFGAEFVSLDQDVLVVYSETENKNHTFYRIK